MSSWLSSQIYPAANGKRRKWKQWRKILKAGRNSALGQCGCAGSRFTFRAWLVGSKAAAELPFGKTPGKLHPKKREHRISRPRLLPSRRERDRGNFAVDGLC